MHTPSIRSITHDAQTSSTGSSAPGTGEYLSQMTGQGKVTGVSGLASVQDRKRPLEQMLSCASTLNHPPKPSTQDALLMASFWPKELVGRTGQKCWRVNAFEGVPQPGMGRWGVGR